MTTPPLFNPTANLDDRLLEGVRKPAANAPKKVRPFHEVAAEFDPMMPKEDYDKARENYFLNYIGRYQKPDKVEAARRDFMSKTERPSLLTTGEKLALPVYVYAHEFLNKVEETGSKLPGNKKNLAQMEANRKEEQDNLDTLLQLGAREGVVGVKAAQVAGQFVEGAGEIEGLGAGAKGISMALEPALAGTKVAKLAYGASFAARTAQRIAKGGATFGIYNTLHAQGDLTHAMLEGTAEGFLWELAPAQTLLGRITKGAVIGGAIGAAEAPEGSRVEGLVEGAISGGVLNSLNKPHPDDVKIQRALTPDLTKPLPKVETDRMAKEAVRSANIQAARGETVSMSADSPHPEVRVSIITPDGKSTEISIVPGNEARMASEIRKLTAAGAKVQDVAYNLDNEPVYRRFLQAQRDLEKAMATAKPDPVPTPVVTKPPVVKPEQYDDVFHQLKLRDDEMELFKQPGGSRYKAAHGAAKGLLSDLAERIVYFTNRAGQSGEERTVLRYWLGELINNRTKPSTDPVVNRAVKTLAYKPELRQLIPPQFRDVFDIATGQVKPGFSFEHDLFQHAEMYKKLEPLTPRRTPEERLTMSRILAQMGGGPPMRDPKAPSSANAAVRMQYDKALQESYAYPEIGSAVVDSMKPLWKAGFDSFTAKAVEKAKPVIPDPIPVPVNMERKPSLEERAKEIVEKKKTAASKLPFEAAVEEYNLSTDPEIEEALARRKEMMARDQAWLEDVAFRNENPTPEESVRQSEIASKSINIQNPGVMEEFIRTGQWVKKSIARFVKIPAGESRELVKDQNYKFEDGTLKVYIAPHQMPEGAGALYQPAAIRKALESLGFTQLPQDIEDYLLIHGDNHFFDERTGNFLAGNNTGMVVLSDKNAGNEFHELLHNAVHYFAGPFGINPEQFGLPKGVAKTMDQIGEGLRSLPSYALTPSADLREEAFAHAATAIHESDADALATFALADTSVDHVVDMVRKVSEAGLTKLRTRPDYEELRYAKDRLEYTSNMASRGSTYRLRQAAYRLASNFYTGPDGSLRLSNGTETHVFDGVQDFFRWAYNVDTTAQVPSHTMALEQMGVRSDTNIRFSPDTRPRAIPDTGDEPWKNRMAISSIWSGTIQWMARAQNKLDQEFRGLDKPPLLEAFKKVDEMARSVAVVQDSLRDEFGKVLAQFPKDRREDVFAFLTAQNTLAPGAPEYGRGNQIIREGANRTYTPGAGFAGDQTPTQPAAWKNMQVKFGMSPTEMENIGKLYNSLKRVDAEYSLGVFNYFTRDLPRLQRLGFVADSVFPKVDDPSKAGFFSKGVMQGRFDPSDRDAGHFINYVIGGIGDRALEKPLRDLSEVMNLKDKDGRYVLGEARKPIQKYINDMQHKPEYSQQILNKVVKGFGDAFLSQASKINRFLPAGAQIPSRMENPQAAFSRLMTLSYASGIMGRVAAPFKDVMNIFTNTMPILGFEGFARGVSKLNAEGWRFAKESGAHLHGMNIEELYGDIFSEIPAGGAGLADRLVNFSSKMMAPSRESHNFSRTITFLGSHDVSLRAVNDLRAGRITFDKFADTSGTWFFEPSERSRFLAKALDPQLEPKEVARQISLATVDRTQWPYRRGTQPLALRTGAGRLFGQYGLWPLNQLEYMKTLGSRALEGGPISRRALIATGTWLAMNTAVYEALHAVGIDASKWLYASPAGYAGGPALQAVQNIFKAPEESKEGLQARKELLELPLEVVPGYNEGHKLFDLVDDPKGRLWGENGPTQEGWIHILGFNPVDEKQETTRDQWDLEQRLLYETGQAPGSVRRRDDLEDELLK